MIDSVDMLHLESVDRLSRFPVVEQTVDLATNLYGRFKQSNLPFVSSVLNNAEATVRGAVHAGLPVAAKFEGPLKTVDAVLCSSLDFVEDKLPAVKLPPEQLYQQTKDYVCTLPVVKQAVGSVNVVGHYGAQKIAELREILEQQKQEQAESKDSRPVISLYVYLSLINALITVTSWVGINGNNVNKETDTKSNGISYDDEATNYDES